MNHKLSILNLTDCNLAVLGLQEIMNSLRKNKSITKVNFSSNEFTYCMPSWLTSMILINTSI